MLIETLSFEDASVEIEQAWKEYVRSCGNMPHHEVIDRKNSVYALARRWAHGFPSRKKKVNELLDRLTVESFGG